MDNLKVSQREKVVQKKRFNIKAVANLSNLSNLFREGPYVRVYVRVFVVLRLDRLDRLAKPLKTQWFLWPPFYGDRTARLSRSAKRVLPSIHLLRGHEGPGFLSFQYF